MIGYTECPGVVLTTPIPDGVCGNPTYHSNVVQALLTAASNKYASRIPQCGDVYGAVYVNQPLSDSNQFLMLEVPISCSPCIGVTKQVACLQSQQNLRAIQLACALFYRVMLPGRGTGEQYRLLL